MRLSFGTDGVRGKAGEWPVTDPGARQIGSLAANLGPRVLVICDTRPSSTSLAESVLKGAMTAGAVAQQGGVAPTSAAQVWLSENRADVAVVVTASHNPAQDNGFKLLVTGGRKMDDAAAARFADALPQVRTGGRQEVVADALRHAWFQRFDSLFRPLDLPVVVDLANGAWSAWRADLQDRMPKATLIGGGEGIVNDGVGSEFPQALCAAVRARAAVGGVAVDGDGDRCVVVDAQGNVVPGDALIGFLAMKSRATQLVVTIQSSGSLDVALPGCDVVRVAVGDRHVRAEMDARGATLGGEESGHMLFSDFPGGDGIVTGIRAFGALGPESLATAVAPFLPWPRCAGKALATRIRPLDEVASAIAAANEGGNRVLVRWSGTEAALRWMVEGRDSDAVTSASETLVLALKTWLK